MFSLSRVIIGTVVGVAVMIVVFVCFHIGGIVAFRIGQFAPLFGAFVGGSLVLFNTVPSEHFFPSAAQPLRGYERLSWILIGMGIITWGLGESVWRYYVATNQQAFPSLADIGYSIFPLLAFSGLLLQPSADLKGKRFILMMDSLITMGSILAIAWYLLLGSLAQAPGETNLAKILGLYYPITDTALLSCVIFLLIRGQQSTSPQAWARRVSLLIIGIGICFFVTSDFLFNIQQNAGTYVEATWIDLGWPFGMMTIGIAACLRRFPPFVSDRLKGAIEERSNIFALNPFQFVSYIMVAALFIALTKNVLTMTKDQQAIRPILVVATLSVVGLIIVRQVFTLLENVRLLKNQAESFARLQQVNKQIEMQAQQIAQQNAELERGIEHLKGIHASLSNGNFRARATLTRGVLWPLAASLNLMAERWSRVAQEFQYTQRLRKALDQLSGIIERKAPILFADMYNDLPEISRLISALSRNEESQEKSAESSHNNEQVSHQIPSVKFRPSNTTDQLSPQGIRRPPSLRSIDQENRLK